MALAHSDDVLAAKLRDRGLRVTSQRLVIHRAVCGQVQHVTAEQVLASVADVLPGTSLPTVYSTLELLEELDLVRRVPTSTGASLFDSRVQPHAHLRCRHCGAVADLDVPPPHAALRRARAEGFSPDHAQLVISGVCADCASSSR